MKKIVNGKELQEKMKESIELLCETVSATLGPKGNNVIIDHSLFSPFITNDGATIAKNIESEDAIVNTILEIAKEASLKTNDTVGDGTTTTLVLLESIFNTSLQYIENGKNPILLKKELDLYLEKLLEKLEKEKRKPSKEDYFYIASIAANDEVLGKIASDAFFAVQNKNAIILKEIDENKLDLEFLYGYTLETQLVSDYFLKEQTSLKLEKASVLILHDYLNHLENIAFILNDCMKNNKNLIIFVNDYAENVLKELISLNLDSELNCCVLKINEYGMHQRKIEHDLEIITNAKVIDNYEFVTRENLGFVENITISNHSSQILFQENNKVKSYISFLENERKEYQDEFEQNFYQKRIAMLHCGLAKILVGSPTKMESHEKRMRLEDALCALDSCKNGVIFGGGVTLLKLAAEIKGKTNAETIFKKSLEMPFIKILTNAGIDYSPILEEITKANYQKIYNVQKEKIEDVKSSSILDSFNVVASSLINATSIATMLLTTTSLVINEYQNNCNKTNEYTEL